jgi:hypothetical protein
MEIPGVALLFMVFAGIILFFHFLVFCSGKLMDHRTLSLACVLGCWNWCSCAFVKFHLV